jgi:hypothetical protein
MFYRGCSYSSSPMALIKHQGIEFLLLLLPSPGVHVLPSSRSLNAPYILVFDLINISSIHPFSPLSVILNARYCNIECQRPLNLVL